ncbi:hypothetical protein D5E69_22840 (plasmid) [Rossellomorea marisflavi]|nr:hypothetical protein D5E69_22840 [Rossellomorea marisflavi]
MDLLRLFRDFAGYWWLAFHQPYVINFAENLKKPRVKGVIAKAAVNHLLRQVGWYHLGTTSHIHDRIIYILAASIGHLFDDPLIIVVPILF